MRGGSGRYERTVVSQVAEHFVELVSQRIQVMRKV